MDARKGTFVQKYAYLPGVSRDIAESCQLQVKFHLSFIFGLKNVIFCTVFNNIHLCLI